jgi:hypothetical protein
MVTEIIIKNEQDINRACYILEKGPMVPTRVVTIKDYVIDRSIAQNRLAFRWYSDASSQLRDGVNHRSFCKLHFGIAIIKNGTSKLSEKFRIQYDWIIKPLEYEQKMALMEEPINFPVTSLFNTKQFSEYLDTMQKHYANIGVVLRKGDDLFNEAMGRY